MYAGDYNSLNKASTNYGSSVTHALDDEDTYHLDPVRSLTSVDKKFLTEDGIGLIADTIRYEDKEQILYITGNAHLFYMDRIIISDGFTLDYKNNTFKSLSKLYIKGENNPDTIIADDIEINTKTNEIFAKGVITYLSDRKATLESASGYISPDDMSYFSDINYTTCRKCKDKAPIWSITAKESYIYGNKIYFKDSKVRIKDTPIFFIPNISFYKPSVSRGSGLLNVKILSNSNTYGNAIQIPYLHVISDTSDVTFTPLITSAAGVVLNSEFRTRTPNGAYTFEVGLGGNNDLIQNNKHSTYIYTKTNGNTSFVNGDIIMDWSIEHSNHIMFPKLYDITEEDLMRSVLRIRNAYKGPYSWAWELNTSRYKTMRENDIYSQISVYPSVWLSKGWEAPNNKGEFTFTSANYLFSKDSENVKKINSLNTIRWDNTIIMPNGSIIEPFTRVRLAHFQTQNDSSPDLITSHVLADTGVTASLPMVRKNKWGGQEVLTPTIMVVMATDKDPNIIDSSLWSEPWGHSLTTLSLFDHNRYEALGLPNHRSRIELALSHRMYNRIFNTQATVGKIYYANSSEAHWHQDKRSNTLFSWKLNYSDNIEIRHDFQLTESNNIVNHHVGANFNLQKASINLNYYDLEQDEQAELTTSTRVIHSDLSFPLSNNIKLSVNNIYNLKQASSIEESIILKYIDQCFSLAIKASKHYEDSSTSYSVKVNLITW